MHCYGHFKTTICNYILSIVNFCIGYLRVPKINTVTLTYKVNAAILDGVTDAIKKWGISWMLPGRRCPDSLDHYPG